MLSRSSEKRQQAKQQEDKARWARIVGEGLRKLVGGAKLCHEEELTRAVLLEFLKSQGEIRAWWG